MHSHPGASLHTAKEIRMLCHRLAILNATLALPLLACTAGVNGSEGDPPQVQQIAGTARALEPSYDPDHVLGYYADADGGGCSTWKQIYVFSPPPELGDGPFPVFLYTAGTWENWNTSPSAQHTVWYAAQQGFVSAFVEYRNDTLPASLCEGDDGGWRKAECMYSESANPMSAVGAVCSLSYTANCSEGIVTAGLSQGGAMAALARNYDMRVRGAWTMGIGDRDTAGAHENCMDYLPGELGDHDRRLLDDSRIRVVRGVNDWTGMTLDWGVWVQPEVRACLLNRTTGRSCDYQKDCLDGPNQSGWYLVPDAVEVDDTLNPAGHCFMVTLPLDANGNKVDCVDLNAPTLQQSIDPVFARVPPEAPTYPGGMHQNILWLRDTILPLGAQESYEDPGALTDCEIY
jgi:hypothetical protein